MSYCQMWLVGMRTSLEFIVMCTLITSSSQECNEMEEFQAPPTMQTSNPQCTSYMFRYWRGSCRSAVRFTCWFAAVLLAGRMPECAFMFACVWPCVSATVRDTSAPAISHLPPPSAEAWEPPETASTRLSDIYPSTRHLPCYLTLRSLPGQTYRVVTSTREQGGERSPLWLFWWWLPLPQLKRWRESFSDV